MKLHFTVALLAVGYLFDPISQGLYAASVASIATGINSTELPLAAGTIDPAYRLIASADPSLASGNLYVIAPEGGPNEFPFDRYWFANTATSQWIVPYPAGIVGLNATSSAGDYTFRTTFDLTGFNPATARINGLWSVDNVGVEILLNGLAAPQLSPLPDFRSFELFEVKNGFIDAVNTLDFILSNNGQTRGNPIGLRI